MKKTFDEIIDIITEDDPRYSEGAYTFVMEALTFTQKKYRSLKHVSGTELLEGIKQLLVKKFGPMTMTVLNHWGIKETEDFGHVVFNLVKNKVLSKTEDDDIQHFRDVYDFEKVFSHDYRKRMAKKISRMR
ncbi:Minf_1886 family protein [Candidatus Omnitrophota bacterium]